MKRIYCISGTGADQRIFKKLVIPGYDLVSLPWVPYNQEDTLPSYARKMAMNIVDKNPILLGLSLGGMIAVEIGKFMPTRQIILVSSAKTCTELPDPGSWAKYLAVNQVLPAPLFSVSNNITLNLMGVISFKDKEELLPGSIASSDGGFIKWALKAVVEWKNTEIPAGVMHIHGTNDLVIPAKNVHPTHWVEGGGHLMIYTLANEVSKIISNILRGTN